MIQDNPITASPGSPAAAPPKGSWVTRIVLLIVLAALIVGGYLLALDNVT